MRPSQPRPPARSRADDPNRARAACRPAGPTVPTRRDNGTNVRTQRTHARTQQQERPMPATESVAFEAFLSGIGNKDRQNIQRHLTAVDAEAGPAHGRLWRRLAVTLRKLAPLAVQTVAQQAGQVFVADGKSRMRVFPLEDKRDGMLQVYPPAVLAAASRPKTPANPSKRAAPAASRSKPANGIPVAPLDAPTGVVAVEYPIAAKAGESLRIES